MWHFFDEHVEAAAPAILGRFEDLGPGDRKAAELFITALKGRRAVIDVGCGTGLPGLYVAPHVGRLAGVDAAPNMIVAARRNAERLRLANVSFHAGGPDGLPFHDAEFDGASLCGLLESMDWESVRRMLSEVRRVLEPGGRVAVLDRDWGHVLRARPPKESAVIRDGDRLMLRVVERCTAPGFERDTRYLVRPDSPSGRRLQTELGGKARTSTSMGPNDLKEEDVLDAWYDEGAQFDLETLSREMSAVGFSAVRVDSLPLWNEWVLFLTASR